MENATREQNLMQSAFITELTALTSKYVHQVKTVRDVHALTEALLVTGCTTWTFFHRKGNEVQKALVMEALIDTAQHAINESGKQLFESGGPAAKGGDDVDTQPKDAGK